MLQAREKVQWIKCLCKSSTPQTRAQILRTHLKGVAAGCNPNTRETENGEPWGKLAS